METNKIKSLLNREKKSRVNEIGKIVPFLRNLYFPFMFELFLHNLNFLFDANLYSNSQLSFFFLFFISLNKWRRVAVVSFLFAALTTAIQPLRYETKPGCQLVFLVVCLSGCLSPNRCKMEQSPAISHPAVRIK